MVHTPCNVTGLERKSVTVSHCIIWLETCAQCGCIFFKGRVYTGIKFQHSIQMNGQVLNGVYYYVHGR